MSDPREEPPPAPEDRPPNLLDVFRSVAAAAFGVQSRRNRTRDFTHGSPVAFIVAGAVFTVVFVLVLVLVVSLVLP